MEVVSNLEVSAYRKFLEKHPEVNFLQSIEWGELHAGLGDVVIRGGIKINGVLSATWLGIVKDAKRGRYLEVPGGPVLDWTNVETVQMALTELKRIAKRQHCVFVRFRPAAVESFELLQLLQQHGIRRAPMHLHAEHTSVIDLTPDEQTLMANMRRQTRYEVRRVAKRGLTVISTTPTEDDIDEFYQLQKATALRHGFITSSLQFLQALRQSLGDTLQLYRAEKDGVLLNLALVIEWGNEAAYFEAASTDGARKEPGAYGIIWQVIRNAKKHGIKRLNLWGIAYNNNPKHRYAGVTTFKRGFGGEDVVYCPAHDIVVHRGRYIINMIVETIRRKRRGL